jgi:hypothetical protein
MEIAGYIGAILTGLILGIIGGGGSILTVPILVYLFQLDAVLATAYSLFIVGLTSMVGSVSHIKLGNIHWKTALAFGIPSICSVFFTRLVIVPHIPNPMLTIGSLVVSKQMGLLVLFAIIMILASYSMIKPAKKITETLENEFNFSFPLIFSEGLIEGFITGLVGVGGGFLIIPVLVLSAKLPMKKAVGTSLMIIAAKSLIGFIGDMKGNKLIDWEFLFIYSSLAIAGILLGSMLSKKIAGEKLKPAFGWFVLMMGIYIILKELL